MGALAWVNQAEARAVLGAQDDLELTDPRLRRHLAETLATLGEGAGSAARVQRLLLLAQPPSLDAGEITDKGYLNQRQCLQCRAREVERLYEPEPGAGRDRARRRRRAPLTSVRVDRDELRALQAPLKESYKETPRLRS